MCREKERLWVSLLLTIKELEGLKDIIMTNKGYMFEEESSETQNKLYIFILIPFLSLVSTANLLKGIKERKKQNIIISWATDQVEGLSNSPVYITVYS